MNQRHSQQREGNHTSPTSMFFFCLHFHHCAHHSPMSLCCEQPSTESWIIPTPTVKRWRKWLLHKIAGEGFLLLKALPRRVASLSILKFWQVFRVTPHGQRTLNNSLFLVFTPAIPKLTMTPRPPYTTQLLTRICRSCCIFEKFSMLLLSLNCSYPQPPSQLWYSWTACGSSAMSGIDIRISGFESVFHQQINLSDNWKCEEVSFRTYDHVSLDLTFARNFHSLSRSCFASSNYHPYFKVVTRMKNHNCFISSLPPSGTISCAHITTIQQSCYIHT